MQNWKSPILMKAFAYLPKTCARPCHGVRAMLLVCLSKRFFSSKSSLFTSSGSGYHGNFLCNQRICIRTYPGSRCEVLRVALFGGRGAKQKGTSDSRCNGNWWLFLWIFDAKWSRVKNTPVIPTLERNF